MKSLKLILASLLFITSLSFNELVLKTQENFLVSNWSVSFGIQSSHALIMAVDNGMQDSVNFE